MGLRGRVGCRERKETHVIAYRSLLIVGIIAGIIGVWRTTGWTRNACVECHGRPETMKAMPAWYQDAFIHWYGSVHGRKGVTCEKCHRGDPTQTDKAAAHQGVGNSTDLMSPLYYKNLPGTCGTCHRGIYQQFVGSRHYKSLKADRMAPSCTTCHGFRMDIGQVVPLQLAGRCALCHNREERGVKPEVVDLARKALEEIGQAEHEIQKARVVIELARGEGREPKEAEELVKTAQGRLKKTGELWHSFRLDVFQRELTEIRAVAGKAYATAKTAILGKR